MKFFRKIMGNESGAVMTVVAPSIIALLVFIGVAIDMGRYFLVRNKILTALDAALLGAADISTIERAQNNPDEIVERGRQFFRANFPAGYLGTNIDDDSIIINVDPASGTVSGEVQNAELPLVFAGIFNLSSPSASGAAPQININVFSEVVREVGAKLEIALVLDYTPSMCFALNTGSMFGNARVYDPSCAKFNAMRNSAISFINQINSAIESSNSPDSQAFYSFIPFTHAVRVNDSLDNFNFCSDINKTRLPSIAGLRNDPDSIISLLQGAAAPTEGGSNVAAGMWWGWSSLRPDSQGAFVGSSAKNAPADTPGTIEDVNQLNVKKILLLLTDGENEYPNRDCQNDFRILSGDAQGFQRDLIADSTFSQLCEGAKAEGVSVYTIAFNVPDNPTITTRQLLNACASPNQSYNANNLEELATVFGEIANDLIDLRITK